MATESTTSIFPWVSRSTLFLVDGVINGRNQLVGKIYPFYKFPWAEKPGWVVWSAEYAMKQYESFQDNTLYDVVSPSEDIERQLCEYFQGPDASRTAADIEDLDYEESARRSREYMENHLYEHDPAIDTHFTSFSVPKFGADLKKQIEVTVIPRLPALRRNDSQYVALPETAHPQPTASPDSPSSQTNFSDVLDETWDLLLNQLLDDTLEKTHSSPLPCSPVKKSVPKRSRPQPKRPDETHSAKPTVPIKTVPRPALFAKKHPPPQEPLPVAPQVTSPVLRSAVHQREKVVKAVNKQSEKASS